MEVGSQISGPATAKSYLFMTWKVCKIVTFLGIDHLDTQLVIHTDRLCGLMKQAPPQQESLQPNCSTCCAFLGQGNP